MTKQFRPNIEKVYVKVNCKIGNRYCGKCCYNTEMILFKEDIERITKLGYPKEFFVVKQGSINVLRNIDGHCVFLDPETNRCKIYKYRPIGCRLYPLVYDASRNRVVIDTECPKARELSREYIKIYEVLIKYLLKREGLI